MLENSSSSEVFFSPNIANNITLVRVLLVPVFILLLFYYSPGEEILLRLAFGVFLLACFTDALDGYLARKLNQKTIFGSYVDPMADKLLLSSGFLSLSFLPNLPPEIKIPAWVTIIVISRDVIILAGSTLIFLFAGTLKASPLFIGKLTTFIQMVALAATFFSYGRINLEGLYIATSILTIISGIIYIRSGPGFFQLPGGGRS